MHSKRFKTVDNVLVVSCVNNLGLTRKGLDDRFPGKIVVMFLNRVYDLSDFTHLGGQYIWQFSKWREISRYLVVAHGHPKDFLEYTNYTHSAKAFVILVSWYIGRFDEASDP
jgi:hypothetical protein